MTGEWGMGGASARCRETKSTAKSAENTKPSPSGAQWSAGTDTAGATAEYAEHAEAGREHVLGSFPCISRLSRLRPFLYDKIILELKAVTELTEEHRAQVQNYLKATGFKLGLLVNFGHYPKVQLERIVAERGRYKPDSQ
jgi:hypothetical protein